MSLVFELPLPPNIANKGGRGWQGKHFGRKAYFAMLDELVTTRMNPRCIAGMPWKKAEADVQMRTWRQADRDNSHARTKPIWDWFQTRGYVINDRDLAYQLDLRTATRADLGVTIVLRELA